MKKLRHQKIFIIALITLVLFIISGWMFLRNNSNFEIIEELNQKCVSDDDCGLPPRYAILSDCPYNSVCIHGECAIVCPYPFTGSKIPVAEGKASAEVPLSDNLLPDGTPNPMQVKLPNNIITMEECEKIGGEVFNTLGVTEYDGILAGTIEGLLCPCACRVVE